MKPIILFTVALLTTAFAAHAQDSMEKPANYGLTLLIVAVIATYSAKLVADKQKEKSR